MGYIVKSLPCVAKVLIIMLVLKLLVDTEHLIFPLNGLAVFTVNNFNKQVKRVHLKIGWR